MFCFYYRYLIHRKMDGFEKINSPILSRHLHHCTACREYDDRMTRFGLQMKNSACGQLSGTDIGQIETSVLKAFDAINGMKHAAHSQQPLWMKRWTSRAVAAGFMIIAGLSGWLYWTHQRNSDTAAAANEAITALSDNVSFLTLFTEHPVRREMTEFVNDAQRAVVFITNCIPQGPSGPGMIPGQTSEIPDN
jgi:predicted anti-sigma-YlaC factor YlaD